MAYDVANNDNELQRLIMADVISALQDISDHAKEIMDKGVDEFYAGGAPKMYRRTGALGNTPEVSPIKVGTNSAEFDAYLDQSHIYNTGKSPDMHDVLDLANYGRTYGKVGYLRPAVGAMGFWDKAEGDIQKSFDKVMGKYFHG